MGRLRQRMDRLEGHAHGTMNEAQQLLAMAQDLVEDIHDGVTIAIDSPALEAIREKLRAWGVELPEGALEITVKIRE